MAATRLQLRKDVLILLNDLQDETLATGDRYKPTHLNNTINNVIRHYVNKLNQFYQGYLKSSLTVNVLASTSSYALGASFRSPIYEVRRTLNSMDLPLAPFNPYEVAVSTTPVPNAAWLPSYHLDGNNLVFNAPPASDEASAIRVYYQTKPTDMSSDTDALDDQLYDAEDCIKIRTAMRLLRAKDVSGAFKNIDGWRSELNDAEAAFFTQVGSRYVRPEVPIPVEDSDYFI